jgi:hypothetical protein
MNKDNTRAAMLEAFAIFGTSWANICMKRGLGKKEQPPHIKANGVLVTSDECMLTAIADHIKSIYAPPVS